MGTPSFLLQNVPENAGVHPLSFLCGRHPLKQTNVWSLCQEATATLVPIWKWAFSKQGILKNFPAEDRTGDFWIMNSLTRPLHQNNLLEIRANSNALWSAGNFCSKFRAAGISNVQIFKSLMSASNFIWKSRESKLFWFVFRVFQCMSGEFLKIFCRFLFSRVAKLPHLT